MPPKKVPATGKKTNGKKQVSETEIDMETEGSEDIETDIDIEDDTDEEVGQETKDIDNEEDDEEDENEDLEIEEYRDLGIVETETAEEIKSNRIKGDDRITKPILFHYERVRILGDRAKQIQGGAKALIKNTENLAPKEIAVLELKKAMIPFKILRERPDGKIEEWSLDELKIVN